MRIGFIEHQDSRRSKADRVLLVQIISLPSGATQHVGAPAQRCICG